MMLCDDFPEYCNGTTRAATGPTPVTLQLNVKNSDAAIERMAKAGAKVTMPATDMFRGDHYGQVVDPFGPTVVVQPPDDGGTNGRGREGLGVHEGSMGM